MHLYSKETNIKSINSGKSFEIELVIQRVLEELKKYAIDNLKSQWNNIKEEDIKWVVTVPAIWENYQKSIMMNACYKAGLINNYTDKTLFFALEPEVASLYCSRSGEIKQEELEKNKYYIICDLGGGTGDIVTHLIGSDKHLEELNPSCGGNYGSNEIDKKLFEDLIFNLFGYKDFEVILRKYKELNINEDEETIFGEWCELERQIKDFKERANLEKVKNNGKFPIRFSIFKEILDKNIYDIVNEYNKKCINDDIKLKVKSQNLWIIELPYKIVYNYIKSQANLIYKTIKDIIDKNESKKIKINTIIFVGGYCSNEILMNFLKKNLENKISHFLRPSKPLLAVMEGAVLFGIDPNIIDTRIAKFTIGMGTRKEWNEKLHSKSGVKVYDEIDKIWRCEDCFDKFIEIHQKLQLGETIIHSFKMCGPRFALLYFYESFHRDPIFVFDQGVGKIGECELDAEENYPPGERSFNVIMKFGGTFIDVKAKHKKSGKEAKTTLSFYNN